MYSLRGKEVRRYFCIQEKSMSRVNGRGKSIEFISALLHGLCKQLLSVYMCKYIGEM